MTRVGLGEDELQRVRIVGAAACARGVVALGKLAGVTLVTGEAVVAQTAAGAASEALAPLGDDVFAVAVRMEGLLAGDVVMALPEAGARRLAGVLGQPVAARSAWSVLAESALLESGNIVGSALVSELARFAGTQLLPGIPELARGAPAACADRLVRTRDGVAVWRAFRAAAGAAMEGVVLVTAERAAARGLLAALDFGSKDT